MRRLLPRARVLQVFAECLYAGTSSDQLGVVAGLVPATPRARRSVMTIGVAGTSPATTAWGLVQYDRRRARGRRFEELTL
jgi:hypothetical protein